MKRIAPVAAVLSACALLTASLVVNSNAEYPYLGRNLSVLLTFLIFASAIFNSVVWIAAGLPRRFIAVLILLFVFVMGLTILM
jgi:hypothetical protein